MNDRSAPGDQQAAPSAADELGHHAATRYRHFRDAMEAMDTSAIDHALFGLLLAAEGMRDEMRTYEEQACWLLRLAQTGHFVRQIQRLHGVLDAMGSQYSVEESARLNEWEKALEQERSERVMRYDAMLASLSSSDTERQSGSCGLLSEVESEEQQEEVLTLLKAAVDKYGDDILTSGEIETTVKAFRAVAEQANMVIMTPPPWLVMPFEFSSSFGLSRWGNDVFLPDAASDTTRFIRDANVWSGLNHPHVAKFLGACHVGGRPFIVHERVRTLSTFVGEVKDRQQMWQRVYEIALGLQYMHQRGVSCAGRLTVKDTFCAECEDKAMVLGIGIVYGDGETPRHHQRASWSSQAASDVTALAVLILNCLHMMSSATSNSQKTELDPLTEYDVVPTARPDFVDESEWMVLSGILQVDGAPSSAMLHVIERLKEIAGMDREHDWFNNCSSIVVHDVERGDAKSIDSFVMPVLGGRSIAEALDECAGMIRGDQLSARIQSRLKDVYEQVKTLNVEAIDASLGNDVVSQIASLVLRMFRFLEQKSCSDASSQFVQSEREETSVFAFHVDIDRLLEMHSLSRTSGVHRWEPHYAVMSSKAQLGRLSALIQPSLPVGSTTKSATAAALATPRAIGLPASCYVIPGDAVQDECGDSRMFDDTELLVLPEDDDNSQEDGRSEAIGTRSTFQRLHALPRWFLAPSEIEFKSITEFSRGAFGSVHHGKWFDSRVVVKRVFTETGDRVSVQAQFLQEADTWFQLNHINVVKMYGACHIGQPVFVCEYASGGELSSYLRRKNREPYLIWYSLLNTALGLQYLHSKGIVHADLKANNILVGSDDIAKLADFGLSVSGRYGDTNEGGGGALGAFRWKAPECLPWRGAPGKAATFASDVYSFAMVMIEVASGAYPWGDSLPDLAVISHAKKGVLPLQPTEVADEEWSLIKRMCCFEPDQRVTIDAVVVHLLSLLERLDMARLWSPIDGRVAPNMYKNHVTSRGGALLSVVELAKSSNKKLAFFATAHLISIQVNRGVRCEKKEVEALIGLVRDGSDREMTWAAEALTALAAQHSDNQVLVASCGGISPLVALARDGNDMQKEKAAGALWSLSVHNDNKALIASCGGIPPLVALVRDGNGVQKRNAATALWSLSVDADNQVLVASCGGIPPLVAMVRDGNDVQKEKAAAALRNLSVNDDNEAEIVSCGGIPPLVALIRDGNDAQKTNAASALSNLSSNTDNKVLIASSGGIPPLVALACDGDDVQKEKAAAALRNLSLNADNKVLIASCGGIPPLVALVRDGSDVQKDQAAAALSSLSANNNSNKAEVASCGGIPPLVALVRDGNDAQKENGAAALCNLSSTNNSNKTEIASCGGVPPLITLVRDGNDVQKEKAAAALWSLSATADNQVLIALCGGIPPLVALVRDGNNVQRTNAAVGLWSLSVNPDNQVLIASCGGIPPLLALVRNGNDAQKTNAAGTLWSLSANADNQVLIASCGGVPTLVALVRDGNDVQKEKAAGALWGLSANADNKLLIASCGGIPPLLALVRDGNDAQKTNAAAALWNLAYQCTVGVTGIAEMGGIECLVRLVVSGTQEQKLWATGTLGYLDPDPETKAVVMANGGVMALIEFIRDSSGDGDKTEGLVALQILCRGNDDMVRASLMAAAGITLLSKMALSNNDKIKCLASCILSDVLGGVTEAS